MDCFNHTNFPALDSDYYRALVLCSDDFSALSGSLNLIGDQPNKGIEQALVRNADLLYYLDDMITKDQIRKSVHLYLGEVVMKVAYAAVASWQLLPENYILDWYFDATSQLITSFFRSVTPPLQQLVVQYYTSPNAITWRPSARLLLWNMNAPDVEAADAATRLFNSVWISTPSFDILPDLQRWPRLDLTFERMMAEFGNDLAAVINDFWANAGANIYRPDLHRTLAEQRFFENAQFPRGADRMPTSFFPDANPTINGGPNVPRDVNENILDIMRGNEAQNIARTVDEVDNILRGLESEEWDGEAFFQEYGSEWYESEELY